MLGFARPRESDAGLPERTHIRPADLQFGFEPTSYSFLEKRPEAAQQRRSLGLGQRWRSLREDGFATKTRNEASASSKA